MISYEQAPVPALCEDPLEAGLTDEGIARCEARWSFAVEPMIDENLTSIVLVGEIDARAQDELDRVLSAAIDAESKLLLVDVSKAGFVSTAAMLSIVGAARHLGRVLLYRPNSATRRIFALLDPQGLCQSIS